MTLQLLPWRDPPSNDMIQSISYSKCRVVRAEIRRVRWFLIFVVGLIAAACARADDGVTVKEEVAFLGADREEKLDAYLPPGWAPTDRRPAVVWIHGGGWLGGDKAGRREVSVCTDLANTGFVVVSVNYRLGRGAWPVNLEDCRNAVRFLRAHAEAWGVDPERIAVAGGSAGGHLALMVAYTADTRIDLDVGPYPGESASVRCVVNLYGITDLRERRQTHPDGTPTTKRPLGGPAEVFGTDDAHADVWTLASPVEHVSPQSPPTLIVHGRADTTVDRDQAVLLARALERHRVPHQVLMLDDVGHTFDLRSWHGAPLPEDVASTVINFFLFHLGLPPQPVALVNGDPVTIGEVVEALRRLRSRYSDPAELRRAALSDCVRFAVTLRLAREHGLIDDVGDAAVRHAFDMENTQRASALASGTVFYGPRRLTWEQFRSVWMDRLQYDLAAKLYEAGYGVGGDPLQMRQGAGIELVEHAVDKLVDSSRVATNEGLLAILSSNTPIPAE